MWRIERTVSDILPIGDQFLRLVSACFEIATVEAEHGLDVKRRERRHALPRSFELRCGVLVRSHEDSVDDVERIGIDILPTLKREDSTKWIFRLRFPRFARALSRGTSKVAIELQLFTGWPPPSFESFSFIIPARSSAKAV